MVLMTYIFQRFVRIKNFDDRQPSHVARFGASVAAFGLVKIFSVQVKSGRQMRRVGRISLPAFDA